MNRIIKIILFSCVLVTGCQIIEEGEVDYVRSVANSGLNAKDLVACNKELYDTSELARAGVTRECYETLYRKYTDVPQIKSGETISVHLMQAFNGAAFEWKNASEFFGGRGSNAEIVIIANVCEQGKVGCSMSFGPSSDKSGRVIFYSNGVKALQYLNFSYLPVYGPIKYEGGPLIIQLTIIELDDPSDQQKAMLKSLASAGQKLYPPASEVLTVLDSVGSAILSNSSDDILFRYSMTLVPDSNSNNYKSPIVAEGNYAFIRKKTEKGPLEAEIVDKLMFDNLTGRLVEVCSENENQPEIKKSKNGTVSKKDNSPCTLDLNTGEMYKDYRKNTYLTFQIKSGFVEKTLDNIQTFEMLLSDINQAADQEALGVIQALSSFENEISSQSEKKKFYKPLISMKRIVSDFPKDEYNKFLSESFNLAQVYSQDLSKLINDCKTPPIKDVCKTYISEEDLKEFQFELWDFLRSIDSNPSKKIDTVVPAGLNNLSSVADLQKALKDGYQKLYNTAVYESFVAEIEVIRNLSQNVKNLKVSSSSDNYIMQRKNLLEKKISDLLDRLAYNHSIGLSLACTSIDEKCYPYLLNSEKVKVAKLINQYLNQYGVTSPNINSTTPTSLTSSLTTDKIQNTLATIMAKF